MPLYDYQCECGKKKLDVFKHITADHRQMCECGLMMDKMVTLPHTDLKEFHTPIEMYSVAVENMEDVHDLKRRCPDADISDNPADPMYGVPIARSRKAKLQVLRASGYVETNSERVRAA